MEDRSRLERARWQKVRRGEEAAPAALPPQKLTREQTELARRYHVDRELGEQGG